MEKQDQVQVCKDCGKEFTIRVSEQNFYESKDLALPKRCEECRAARKAMNAQQNETKPKQSLEDMMRDAFGDK